MRERVLPELWTGLQLTTALTSIISTIDLALQSHYTIVDNYAGLYDELIERKA